MAFACHEYLDVKKRSMIFMVFTLL